MSAFTRTKRLTIAGAAALAMFTFAGLGATAAQAAPNDLANIPDAALRACLNAKLTQPPTAEITEMQIASINDWLSCNNRGIADLTGLEHLTGAKNLNLSGNLFTDLTPLLELQNLTRLELTNSQISDLSPIGNLAALEDLTISYNDTCDLGFVANLTQLTELSASNCGITEISAIASVPQLKTLDLEDNEITNIDSLAGLTLLDSLNLDNNQIGDISALGQKPLLKYLYFSNNEVKNLEPLKDSTQIRMLSFENNNVADISVLSGFAPGYTLYAAGNHIIDASPAVNQQDSGSFDEQTHQITVVSGAATPNPVRDLDGQKIADPTPYYDTNNKTFTFPAAGTYETEWTASVYTRNAFSGTITWTVVDQTLVVPENPVVVQAIRNADGTVSDPSVTPASTVGLDYSLSISNPQPGDTVVVTATPQALFAIDAANLPSGWVFNEQNGTASFTVTLDKLPKPVDPTKPVEPTTPINPALPNTGSEGNGLLPLAAGTLMLGGLAALLIRRAKKAANS